MRLDPLNVLVTTAAFIILVMILAWVYGTHLEVQQQRRQTMLKRIPIDDHPDLVKMIEDTYTGAQVISTYVHKITIDEGDVTIEIDLEIDGTWGIAGSFQIGLDDDNSLAEKLREIIQAGE